jgi:hypothetical protein
MRFLIVPAWQYPGTAVLCSFRLADKSLALGTHNDEIPNEFFRALGTMCKVICPEPSLVKHLAKRSKQRALTTSVSRQN